MPRTAAGATGIRNLDTHRATVAIGDHFHEYDPDAVPLGRVRAPHPDVNTSATLNARPLTMLGSRYCAVRSGASRQAEQGEPSRHPRWRQARGGLCAPAGARVVECV